MKYLIAATTACLFVPFASADSWVIRDLGATPDRETCLDRGELLFRQYKADNSGGTISRGNWSVFAYGLGVEERNVVFTCPTHAGITYALMYSHDDRPAEKNEYAIDILVQRYKDRY